MIAYIAVRPRSFPVIDSPLELIANEARLAPILTTVYCTIIADQISMFFKSLNICSIIFVFNACCFSSLFVPVFIVDLLIDFSVINALYVCCL